MGASGWEVGGLWFLPNVSDHFLFREALAQLPVTGALSQESDRTRESCLQEGGLCGKLP